MQAPGLVNAGTYGAHVGKWFRFFQVLDCSAAVRAARVLRIWAAGVPVFYVGDISERTDFCGGSLTSSRSQVLGLRCASGLTFSPSMWYNILVEVRVEISGAPLLFAKTRAALFISTKNAEFAFLMHDFAENLQNGRVNFNFRLNCGQFFNS